MVSMPYWHVHILYNIPRTTLTVHISQNTGLFSHTERFGNTHVHVLNTRIEHVVPVSLSSCGFLCPQYIDGKIMLLDDR